MPPKKKQAVGEEAPAPAAGVGAATKLDLARGDTISPSSETFSPLLEPESEANPAGAVALKPEKEQQPPAEKQKVRTEHPTGASRARADPVRIAQRAPGSPRKSHKRRHKFKDHLPRPKGLLLDDGLRVFWDAPPTAPPRPDEEGSDAAAALEGSIDWKSLGATSPRDDAAVVLPGVSTLPASQYNDLLLTNPYRPPPTYLRCADALARLPAPRGEFLLCALTTCARASDGPNRRRRPGAWCTNPTWRTRSGFSGSTAATSRPTRRSSSKCSRCSWTVRAIAPARSLDPLCGRANGCQNGRDRFREADGPR